MIRFLEGDDLIIPDESQLPFKLLRNLGHGHSGNVEEVENVLTGAVFARKTIKIRGQRAKIATENIFKNEVKIIRGLSKHHHIIRVFATYMAKREVGIILEPVADEGDLSHFLELIEDIRLSDASDIRLPRLLGVLDRAFGCLAGGLAFMHKQKVRHKDIKPQNILVHRGSVIYTDFGYSLDSSHLSCSTTEGQPDSLTRRYSAPEVLECGERNSSSDVFSLGCVYLELLAAKSNDPTFISCKETFSADLDNVHRYLNVSKSTDHISLICSTIIYMTERKRNSRVKAAHVMEAFFELPGYRCGACRALEPTDNGGKEILPPNTSTVDLESQVKAGYDVPQSMYRKLRQARIDQHLTSDIANPVQSPAFEMSPDFELGAVRRSMGKCKTQH
jgi:serine/threonine protein kinase